MKHKNMAVCLYHYIITDNSPLHCTGTSSKIKISTHPSSLDVSGEGQHGVLHVEGPQTLRLPDTPVAIHLDLTVLAVGGGGGRGQGGGERGREKVVTGGRYCQPLVRALDWCSVYWSCIPRIARTLHSGTATVSWLRDYLHSLPSQSISSSPPLPWRSWRTPVPPGPASRGGGRGPCGHR